MTTDCDLCESSGIATTARKLTAPQIRALAKMSSRCGKPTAISRICGKRLKAMGLVSGGERGMFVLTEIGEEVAKGGG